jgi:hypothetical protein
MENEDSVVTSLNELRKLKHERISRQTQSRTVASAARAVALAEDPAQDQLTPPPVQSFPVQQPQSAQSFGQASNVAAFSANRPAFAPVAYDHSQMAPTAIVQTKTSYKAAVAVAVVFAGAAGVGYFKLQNDMQASLAAKDVAIRQAEEGRNKSVEIAAKADQQAKANLRQCEDKLKASMAAVAPAAPAVPAAAAASVEKPEKPASTKVARTSHKASAKPARHVAAREPAPAPAPKASKASSAEKGGDIPTIAKKKKLDNDPLAGLGKL